ncbi:MAG: hypothetical protein IJD18_00410 [Clostridia bacterium]|nr:hypothetical protein [Clostridia bacterium]
MRFKKTGNNKKGKDYTKPFILPPRVLGFETTPWDLNLESLLQENRQQPTDWGNDCTKTIVLPPRVLGFVKTPLDFVR